jgi:hypothetical protein
MNRILLIAALCFLVVSSAFAEPATLTVAVNCNEGDSITKALRRPAVELTIEISGICEEDVHVLRSNVTLRGTDPLIDGIRPAVDDVLNQALNLFGVNTILIENLKITGGRMGIGINYSFGVTLRNCLIEENDFGGVIAGTGSGSIFLHNTVITSTAVAPDNPRRGIWVTNGSNLTCDNCTVENHRTGILLDKGSEMSLIGSTVRMARIAVEARGGSRLMTRFASDPNTFEGNTLPGSLRAAIRLIGNASADLGRDTILDRIIVEQKSAATLRGSFQINSSSNRVDSGSSLVARDDATLDGDFLITEFSNLTLPERSIFGGSLSCSMGADAFCFDPLRATSSSNCGQCFNPGLPFP